MASSSVTVCSGFRDAPGRSTTRPASMKSCTAATTSRSPSRATKASRKASTSGKLWPVSTGSSGNGTGAGQNALRARCSSTAESLPTVICVLTHDPKFDVPLLEVALRTHAAYVGAMGCRRTHSDRLARLLEVGLTDAELAGLASPIGLDIGARTPEETAVSIAAEITQHRWGGTGRPLTETAGEIHRDRLVAP